MTTSLAEPDVESTARLLTTADLAALPNELPSGPVKYELEEGRLVVMAPAGDSHGASQLRIGSELLAQGERRGYGKARTEVGVIIGRAPDTVLVPEVVFVANRSLPIRTSPEGYLESVPDIAVEIRSKNDSIRALHRKAERYLQAGVQLVWVVDPQTKTISELRKGAAPVELHEVDVLTAGEIIPGFAVPVAALFAV